MNKKCSRCKLLKPLSSFGKDKNSKSGLNYYCRECANYTSRKRRIENIEHCREVDAKWREKNRTKCCETVKRYRQRNIDKVRQRESNYRAINRERLRESYNKWRLENPDKSKNATNNWVENNKDKMRELGRLYRNKRRKEDYKFKLNHRFSSLLRKSISSKNGHTWEQIVGYTISDLIKHIESKFTEGMSWNNYGRYGWHIDHIIPISAFNYSNYEDIDFKKCWDINNLQPLWASDNIRKCDRLEKPFQPSLCLSVN